MKVAMWMCAVLFGVLVITSAAAQSCPANQVASDAQILIYTDSLVPASSVRLTAAGNFDPDLTFFSDVLGYNDDQIRQETQNVFQFFSERFGLNFSLTQPNELGQVFFQNATLQSIRRVNPINVLFNRWILTGNTRSRCFETFLGGYLVTFSGEQILKGTYGGEEGIGVPSDRILSYEYVSISSPPPCEPVVILRTSPIPNESQRIGLFVIFYELTHPTLGQGSQAGFVQAESVTAANGTDFLRFSGSALLTFPPNVMSFN